MKDMIPDGRRSKKEQFNPYKFFAGACWWDNYAEHSPEDSDLWLKLFERSSEVMGGSEDLRAALMYCRNTGAVLIKNPDYGYYIRPVIGKHGWGSMEEYEKERAVLMKWKNEIVGLLGELES